MFRVLFLFLAVFFSTAACAGEVEVPTFKKGNWHFERIVTHAAGTSKYLPNARQQFVTKIDRCVDPTVAMQGTFASDIGSCHASKPEKIGDTYIIAHRCDFQGPVRTEITVKSEDAYVEINESHASHKIDKVVATRSGECD